MNDTVSEDAERLIALGQNEADFYAEWLRGNDGAVLSPFALRGLAHSFGRILAATKPPLADVTPIGWTSQNNIDGLSDHDSFVIGSIVNRPSDDMNIPVFLASPPMPGRGEGFDVDMLAQEIRRVDGDSEHRLGAGALAEALMPFLAASRPKEEKANG